MPSGKDEISGLRITFPKVTRHHSGVYTCSADNGFRPLPPTAHKTISLDVQRTLTIPYYILHRFLFCSDDIQLDKNEIF